MTQEQKDNLIESLEKDNAGVWVEPDLDQQEVIKALGLTKDEVEAMARNSFSSALRGKLQGAIDKAIKDKYKVSAKGKKAAADAYEEEIQQAMKLKARIS